MQLGLAGKSSLNSLIALAAKRSQIALQISQLRATNIQLISRLLQLVC